MSVSVSEEVINLFIEKYVIEPKRDLSKKEDMTAFVTEITDHIIASVQMAEQEKNFFAVTKLLDVLGSNIKVEINTSEEGEPSKHKMN